MSANDASSAKRGLSLGKVAQYCGVTRKTILRWVQDGLIQSFTLPSGHHRVQPEELVRFLRAHDMPVPEDLSGEAKQTVLVVDDEAHIRRLISDLLRSHFNVEEATNGVEACLKMGANPPAILMLDYRMPHMDGVEVIRQVRRDKRFAKTKIVVVSAHVTQELTTQLEGLADAILKKPFSPAQIVETAMSVAFAEQDV